MQAQQRRQQLTGKPIAPEEMAPSSGVTNGAKLHDDIDILCSTVNIDLTDCATGNVIDQPISATSGLFSELLAHLLLVIL